jgi:hypothetical protein
MYIDDSNLLRLTPETYTAWILTHCNRQQK